MNQALLYLRYSSLNMARKLWRLIVSNKTISLVSALLFIFSCLLLFEFSSEHGFPIEIYLPYVLLAYAFVKALQDAPALTLPHYIFLAPPSLTAFKALLILKIIAPTVLFSAILLLLKVPLTLGLASSLIVSIGSNFISLLKTQTSSRSSIVMLSGFLVSSITSVHFSVIALAGIVTALLAVAFAARKFFVYDELYPYFQSIQALKDAMEGRNQTAVFNSQQAFMKSKQSSVLVIQECSYDTFILIRLELSRALNHVKALLGCCAVIFVADSLYLMVFGSTPIAQMVATFFIFIVADGVIAMLNNIDASVTSANPAFFRSFGKSVEQKYFAHLFISCLLLIAGLPIFIGASPLPLLVAAFLLPIQNILALFAPTKPKKAAAYLLKLLIFNLILLEYFPLLLALLPQT